MQPGRIATYKATWMTYKIIPRRVCLCIMGAALADPPSRPGPSSTKPAGRRSSTFAPWRCQFRQAFTAPFFSLGTLGRSRDVLLRVSVRRDARFQMRRCIDRAPAAPGLRTLDELRRFHVTFARRTCRINLERKNGDKRQTTSTMWSARLRGAATQLPVPDFPKILQLDPKDSP